MRYSSLTTRIAGQGAAAWTVHTRAMERIRAGEDVIALSIGDPDFDTPVSIRQAAVEALSRGRTHYSPVSGEPRLQAAVAQTASGTLGRPVEAEQVTVFPGAQAALFGVTQCLFDRGDEVIVVEPTYVTYGGVFGAPNAEMVQVPIRPEDHFHLDPTRLARAITTRTRGVVLNFPHNPTGACLTRDEGAAIAELCLRHDLWLVSDEVYGALMFEGRAHHSPIALPGMAERGVLISSLSKSHAMTGWRCGWAVTPKPLAAHLHNFAQAMYFGVAQFVQDAAATALTSGMADLESIRSSYQRRASVAVKALEAAPGLSVRIPEAGMYLFADVRGTGLSGTQFASGLLDAVGVAVTPGEGFGPSGAGHVRITLGTDEVRLVEACRRMVAFARGLPDLCQNLQLTERR